MSTYLFSLYVMSTSGGAVAATDYRCVRTIVLLDHDDRAVTGTWPV